MARATHLYRRQATYWWRRRYPSPLDFGGFRKDLFRISVRTSDRGEATHRAARLRILTDVLFAEATAAVMSGLQLTKEAFSAIVRTLVLDELDAAERARALRPVRSVAETQAATAGELQVAALVQQELAVGAYDRARPTLEAVLSRIGAAVSSESDDFKLLLRLAMRGLIQVHRANAARERGSYEEDDEIVRHALKAEATSAKPPVENFHTTIPERPAPHSQTAFALLIEAVLAAVPLGMSVAPISMPSPQPISAPTPTIAPAFPAEPPVNPTGGPMTISQAFSGYMAERVQKTPGWAKHMKRKQGAAGRLLVEAIGDLPLRQVTRAHILEFRALAHGLPKTHGKGPAFYKPIRELVAATDALEREAIEPFELQLAAGEIDRKTFDMRVAGSLVQRVDPGTVQLHIDRITAIFEWAMLGQHFDGICPTKGTRPTQQEIAAIRAARGYKSRLPWGDGLPALLSSAIFADPGRDFGDPLFWAPIMAAHMGLREEEALQGQIDDFQKIDGVDCYRVGAGAGQSVKTFAGGRFVPIPQFLRDAGLMELVEKRRSEGSIWLFPMLDKGASTGSFSEIFTKRFLRYRREVGLYDEQKDFHSLRHDFNVALRGKGVVVAARKRLMGHHIVDITDGDYDRLGEPMAERLEFVNRIDFGLSIRRVDGIPVISIRPSSEKQAA